MMCDGMHVQVECTGGGAGGVGIQAHLGMLASSMSMGGSGVLGGLDKL
jgi:hypothetical protein